MTAAGGGEKHGVILAAPTERGPHMAVIVSELSVRTSLPLTEGRGCDFTWVAQGALHGVQRKELKDLMASVQDGRLAKEMAQATHLGTRPWLIIEGRLERFGEEYVLPGGRQSIPVRSWWGMLASVEQQGWSVTRTDTATDTGYAICAMHRSTRKEKHGTGRSRPKAAGVWGEATSKEWAAHLLQGFDGIGPDVARAIVEELGLPLQWTVDEKQLMKVPGVGKVRAHRLIQALGGAR